MAYPSADEARAAAARPGAAQPRRPLVALLVAEVVSTTGSEMAAVALPWFVLVTTGSPARMATVMAAEFIGMTLLGVPSGRVAGALGPRRTMLVSDLARGPVVALVPVLHWAGLLSFPVLLAVAFTTGAFFPAYSSSQRLVIADLLGADELRLTRVGGLFGSVNETASFVGPALAGVLVAALGPANVLLIDAASYLVAFTLVVALVPVAARGAGDRMDDGGGSARTSVLAGVRYLARTPRVLRLMIGVAVIEIGWTALMATLPVTALHRYAGGARLAGWLVAAYGAGSVAGGLLSIRARRTGDRTATLAVLGVAAATWVMLVPLPVWGLALAVAAIGVCNGLFFPRFFSALTVRTPAPLRPSVMASVTTVISAPGPLGFLGAGLLMQRTGSVAASFVLVSAAATVGAAVAVTGGPARAPADVPGTPGRTGDNGA